jgi:uronate dehydrogenase
MVGSVLLTGAAGTIGATLRAGLPANGWQLTSVDVRSDGDVSVTDVRVAEQLDAVMEGVDAVVHLAVQGENAWPVIRDANIEGTFQVFEAARRHRVRRVIYASSNHAVGFTPQPVGGELPADIPPRPDTLYGVSKAFGEALARYYVDRYGMQVACLRIGTFAERPPDLRALGTWLSPDDCVRLVDACLRSPDLSYALVWGISANTRRTWSLEAGYALGYFPVDDAERYAESLDELSEPAAESFVGENSPPIASASTRCSADAATGSTSRE